MSRIVSTILAGGVPQLVVVAGAHIDAVRKAMPPHDRRARVVEHPGWQQGQLSSLIAGLNAIDDPLLEAVVVTPVDVPLVTPFTVAAVISAWRRARAPIVRPVESSTSLRPGGRRHGHPVVFDRAVFDELRSANPDIGAKAIFATHQARILNVEVKDAGAFEDIDTPDDYERLVLSP